jgi:RNA polymerase sigma-54 factor
MALEARLVQKLSQSLLMTPQLQQAIKLLQLGRVEYLEAIEKELLENPILEEVREDGREFNEDSAPTSKPETEIIQFDGSSDNSDSNDSSDNKSDFLSSSEQSDQISPSASEPTMDWEGFVDSFTDYQGAATPKGLIDHEDRPSYEGSTSAQESLSEHLISQIRYADVDEKTQHIAAFIIGNLDSNGYLATEHQELANEAGCSLEELLAALDFVRSLDPAGVAAKDLKECLQLQLEFAGLSGSLAFRIVESHLEKLEKRKLDVIAKIEKVTIEEVKKAVEVIRKLEPHPGRNFSEDTARYVTPDVYVQKVAGEYVLSLNEEGMPKLRVNPYYLGLLKNEAGDAAQNKQYLQDRLKAAAWLIRSDMQRRQTILKVAESIVKFQRPFLDHGISRLRPLVLKDVADDIGMHESTVSRVTSNKYMHTSQGVFELKFFFTTGIKTAGGDVSASSIRDRIKTIIAQETQSNPVSDQEIVEILNKEKVEIARRTVAKYRETLGIQPSSQRKKAF